MQLLLLVLSLFCVSRGDDSGGVSKEKKLKKIDTFPTGNCTIQVQDNDIVTWESFAYFTDGRRFDTGVYEGRIGHHEMVVGLNEGLKGLCSGDSRSLIVSGEWGFGEEGVPHRHVAPNATLVFDVRVLHVSRFSDVRTGLKMGETVKIKDNFIPETCGMQVKGGDKIHWKYSGKLTNGEIFDEGTFTATIDNREVIEGVNDAMQGLCVGGKRFMLMHHIVGYGARGTGGIPPYANLIFDVELLSINRPNEGWETIETNQRKARVSAEDPIKMTDTFPTGQCKERTVQEGDTVTFFVFGYLLDGTMFNKGEQKEARLGKGDWLQGIEKGLIGLCTGDDRTLLLHPSVAHGERGVSGLVPINATVIYDIRVMGIERSISPSEDSKVGVDEKTGLKQGQLLKIEIVGEVAEANCTIKSDGGDTIHWKYRGTFLDGTEFYKGLFKATLGANQVITGVDRGMRNMCIGEKRKLTIASEWAYGKKGRPGSVPPDSTLIFENLLLNIERPPPKTPTTPETEAEL